MGVSESNVAVRLNRARECLNTKLSNAVWQGMSRSF
ncbi:hypothetical protein PVT68_13115 [Microbulbifer bruguierae]|uniref:RNA polymerase sigma factor 70 region 4 type 2 domain-containing protein n=1 Tax=Microbulbifer bruguierae TaxID=3029061 RepID=A0ABY8N9X9_9GAMM|nr:hypothetical protein [Microbulbifer bruguierae]WGL15706.1 hypothetical protein PVT68_13115 [Microbulbifer bruguierae]